MILLNYGHPLTNKNINEIESAIGQEVTDQQDYPVQFDLNHPFADQVSRLTSQVGFTSDEWQTLPILINPPAHSLIALALFAELHGRMGYFPAVIRLKPQPGVLPIQFEFAEIINLQAVRDSARRLMRGGGHA